MAFKEVVNRGKKIAAFIRRILKMTTTVIGQIILYLVAAILIGILVFIIVTTIFKSIGRLLGVNGGAQTGKLTYDFQQFLSESGYDKFLNAEELVDYYAFEYAVLMDAARFMEETGTLVFDSGDPGTTPYNKTIHNISTVDCLKDITTRSLWAEYAAKAFQTDRYGSVYDSPIQLTTEYTDDSMINISSGDFYTTYTEKHLKYEPVYNENTKEEALYPYLVLNKDMDILTYFIEYQDNGLNPNSSNRPTSSNFYLEQNILNSFIGTNRWSGTLTSVTQGDAADFIYEHIFPLHISSKLNSMNKAAYESKDASYGVVDSLTVEELYEEHKKGLFYATSANDVEYKIPLKILLDRFLPNATLLSAWRILSDENDATSDDLVDEIQKIYSEACLSGEKYSGDKLLVKEVFYVNATIDDTKTAKELLKNEQLMLIGQAPKEKFIDNSIPDMLLNYYEALFDSRKIPNSGYEGTFGSMPVQDFNGGFSGDVIDDIKIALTHYAKDNGWNQSDDFIDRVLEDCKNINIMNPVEITPEAGDFIIYTPDINNNRNEQYLVDCVYWGNSDKLSKEHYAIDSTENLADYMDANNNPTIPHLHSDFPYNKATEDTEGTKQCFVPFMKIAYTQEKGLRRTAVIIHNNGIYKAYIIKGKEINDSSTVTNEQTFAVFEAGMVQTSTFMNWEFATDPGVGSQERWIVEDAFEGMSIDFDNPNYYGTFIIEYKLNGSEGRYNYNISLSEIMNELTISERELYEWGIGKDIPAEAVFQKGHYAIVRDAKYGSRAQDSDLLKLPSNATPKVGLGYNNTCTLTDEYGETEITGKNYINLKKVVDPKDTIVFDNYMIAENIRNIILNYKGEEYFADIIERELDIRDESLEIISFNFGMSYIYPTFSVIFPTRACIIPITQDVKDNKMPFYLVKQAKTWSSIRTYDNKIVVRGQFKDRDHYGYILHENIYAKGLTDYVSNRNIKWRAGLYAPVFAGDSKESETKARETDILLVASQWEEASNSGIQAADYYLRDLYNLINYSKGVKIEDVNGNINQVGPIEKPGGGAYVHELSYTNLYIPEEILDFDESTSEKAFWQDRLLNTGGVDEVKDELENKMRSKKEIFTWQIVDYDLYDECKNPDGETSSVYALWPYGDQLSRALYAFESNASEEANLKVMGSLEGKTGTTPGWGAYSESFHKALDLYGRTYSDRIYKEIFSTGVAKIKSTYSNGKVKLIGTNQTPGVAQDQFTNPRIKFEDTFYTLSGCTVATNLSNPDEVIVKGKITINNKKIDESDFKNKECTIRTDERNFNYKITSCNINFDANDPTKCYVELEGTIKNFIISTDGHGVYFGDIPVRLKLGDTTYEFKGSAAAVYGYELYRLTLTYKDPEKAEKVLKEQLMEEQVWTEIRAMAPGVVTSVKADATSGFMVKIQHSDTTETIYCHMKRFPLVQEGDYVGAGSVLGYEGTTGKSKGMHLHTSIKKDTLELDPNGNKKVKSSETVDISALYPFFTPFYYEEKADEADYNLASEYMSLERTVFPYGQYAIQSKGDMKDGYSGDFRTGITTDGFVEIKNYVPRVALVDDYKDLYTSSSEHVVDFSELPAKNVYINLGASMYKGEILETFSGYFDSQFIADVKDNGDRIWNPETNKRVKLTIK